ncbi:hypothetical protein AAMO2058_001066200 [Amorphochlora amoebiformis]|uniref:Uncharacterized protein n=1 Tax=Amorphochlora amoebiformis TaxID=1561963 RepID=A0A7S0GLQ7_9EUKA|mmetsp:Transcript_12572/g.19988  ORF Transcript_12572/g.19988 Transcript_12572/m.19988 type:complete len:197 (+) Transcript_12572:40-630(+)
MSGQPSANMTTSDTLWRDPKLREKIVNFGFNKKLTAGAPTVRKAISEFFFNAHHPKPWLNNYVWKMEFLSKTNDNTAYMHLDHLIDITFGGLLRFLDNPRIGESVYGESKRISMRDINLYLRKLPPSIRHEVGTRLEQRLNEEGYSLQQSENSTILPGILARQFVPKMKLEIEEKTGGGPGTSTNANKPSNANFSL